MPPLRFASVLLVSHRLYRSCGWSKRRTRLSDKPPIAPTVRAHADQAAIGHGFTRLHRRCLAHSAISAGSLLYELRCTTFSATHQ